MSNCTAHNGTYTCRFEANHTGLHEHRSKIRNGSNVVTGIRVARFEGNYSPVRFSTVPA